tara:strand:- start:447 stop:656 length:210 start_codon:yes stop_codon:yes gene_type:complete
MIKIKKWTILLLMLASAGCVGVKLNGFQEIAERNPVGFENAVETDEGAEFIRQLGRYINQLEQQIEAGQ